MLPRNILYLIADHLTEFKEIVQFLRLTILAGKGIRFNYLNLLERRIKLMPLIDKYSFHFKLIEEMVINNVDASKFKFLKRYAQRMRLLIKASETDNYDLFLTFINTTCINVRSLLKAAIKGRSKRIIEYIANSYSTSAKTHGMYFACKMKNFEYMEFFSKRGAKYLLKTACLTGDVEYVKKIIELGSCDFKNGFVSAVKIDNVELCELMISNGCKINIHEIHNNAITHRAPNVFKHFCPMFKFENTRNYYYGKKFKIGDIPENDSEFVEGVIKNKKSAKIFKFHNIDTNLYLNKILYYGSSKLVEYAYQKGADIKLIIEAAINRSKYKIIKLVGLNFDYSCFVGFVCKEVVSVRIATYVFDHVDQNMICPNCLKAVHAHLC